jgi:hypothetical protein
MTTNEKSMKITEINYFMHESLDKQSKILDNQDKLGFVDAMGRLENLRDEALSVAKKIDDAKKEFDGVFEKFLSERKIIDNITNKYR